MGDSSPMSAALLLRFMTAVPLRDERLGVTLFAYLLGLGQRADGSHTAKSSSSPTQRGTVAEDVRGRQRSTLVSAVRALLVPPARWLTLRVPLPAEDTIVREEGAGGVDALGLSFREDPTVLAAGGCCCSSSRLCADLIIASRKEDIRLLSACPDDRMSAAIGGPAAASGVACKLEGSFHGACGSPPRSEKLPPLL